MQFLIDSYATRGGAIDPWGTFTVLANGIIEIAQQSERDIGARPGLPVWSVKLVQYGKGGFRVAVNKKTVLVLSADGTLVDKIHHAEFTTVDIWQSFVHKNGYLQASITRTSNNDSWVTNELDQAANGNEPDKCDNSPFTKVDVAFAGQEVVLIELHEITARIVFSLDGNLIPSTTHHPLSYAKWAPESESARYGTVD